MDLFVFPASLILLLSFLRIKYKTFHNSIFAVSNNVTAIQKLLWLFYIFLNSTERELEYIEND